MRRLLNWFNLRFAPSKLLGRLSSNLARRTYFVREYEGTYRQVWKNEFKLKHFRSLREDIRREYDKVTEDLEAALLRIKTAEGEIKSGLEKIIEGKKK
mgnify:CR=1 FL=1